MQPQHHVDVGHSQIGVEQHDVPALCGDGYRQIGRHRGFAHAPLAAGDCDNLDRARGIEFGQRFGTFAR
jgi:hypothetical protein